MSRQTVLSPSSFLLPFCFLWFHWSQPKVFPAKGHTRIVALQVPVDDVSLAALCRRHHIRKLSFFGSATRRDFSPQSDIDILVEFLPGQDPGFFTLATIEAELSVLLDGRTVDLRTPLDLSRHFREQVLREAESHYIAA